MEKYYYEIEGVDEEPCMLCTDERKIGSKECLNCHHFEGIDFEEKWIKCYLYSCVGGFFTLGEDIAILQHRINELEGIISDLQGQEVCNG